jgi:hypothetical protein
MPTVDFPWAIILCRFSDISTETRPASYYVDLFTHNGTGGICDYWRSVTFNSLNLTSSAVFGWFAMAHSSSEVSQLTFPGDRWKLVQWGLEAANANGIDLSRFRSSLVIHNFGVDHGFAGNGVVIVHSDPTLCEFGFICHEMGHGMGLPHSWSASPDVEYGDGWDVMSFATTTFQFPIAFEDSQGAATVGLNARNADALQVIPAGRTWVPSGPDFSASIRVDPMSQPPLGNHGFLVAKIPPGATVPARSSQSTFTVEFHRKAGWDQAIPQDAVLVHEIRSNGISYLQPSMWGQFQPGGEFVTPSPQVFIRVTSFDAATSSAALRIWDVPDGGLRKEDSKPKVYLIQNGTKRWVTSPAVLSALGKSWTDVKPVPDGGLSTVPDGPDVQIIQVAVSPYPVPLNRAVPVTVQAVDVSSGANVPGDVEVDGQIVGATGTPFTHTFRAKRVRIPGPPPPEWERTYPAGSVRASGYPDAPIDFGFPEV